jgi:hypothetical protein
MANKKIAQLTSNSTPPTSNVIATQDSAGSIEATKSTIAELKTAMGLNLVDNTSDATKWAATATLTNKTFSLGSNTLSGTLAQLNTAISDADVASLDGTETLTNKTISGASNTFSNIPQSAVTSLMSDLAAKQPIDSDLTTIAGLTPTNNDILQYKSGAWANRTLAQLKTDLALSQSDITNLVSDLATKQATLVSGTNIKTINGSSILGSGDLVISGSGGGAWGTITGTISSQTDLINLFATKKDIQIITQAAHGFTVGMAVQRNTSGTWIRCRASNSSNLSYADGYVVAVVDSSTFKLGNKGDIFDATGLGLSSNTIYYLATTTSGVNYTTTAPSAVGDVYKEVFRTNAANQAYIIDGPSFEITTATSGSGGGNKYWKYQQWEHFLLPPQNSGTVAGSSLVMTNASGTGASFTTFAAAASTMTGYAGVVTGSTGTTTTGWASLGSGNYANLFRFDGTTKVIWMTKLYIDTLRNGTDDYRITVGFGDNVGNGALPADGAYFLYDSVSANWQYVTANNSSRTTAVSTVAVNALTTYILEVEFDGTGFNFYINGTLVNGSPVTTNTPITSGRETSHGIVITKTAGTTARTVNVDWVAFGVDYA